MFTVTAAFESLQPRAQDVRSRDDAMKLARELSRISELEVLVAPKGSHQPSCVYKSGVLVSCACPDGGVTGGE